MRPGSVVLSLLLGVGWVVLFVVSFQAVRLMGLGMAGDVFVGDFAHPWRAQFNADFAAHLLLVAAWMVYRSSSRVVGLICGALAIFMGGVFTLAYLLVVLVQAKGDMRRLLLGRHTTGS